MHRSLSGYGRLGERKQIPNVTAYAQEDAALGLPNEQDNSARCQCMSAVLHYIEDLKTRLLVLHRVLARWLHRLFNTPPFADFECTISVITTSVNSFKKSGNLVGTPVQVSFYRCSLTELCQAVTNQAC
ncbi:hypothetical protein O9929_20570 [Vibrio lentus]|nr:hypothetical protein [Vibrio lentus]